MQDSPLVISNVVILQYAAGELYVTLASVGETSSTKQTWHLPSAQIGRNQTSIESLEKGLRATLGLQDRDISYREQLYTSEFTSPAHSTICISYLYLSSGTHWFKGSHQVGTFPVSKLPRLSSADSKMIQYALDRLHAKALYSTIIRFLVPDRFNLTELQLAFETLTRQSVDRRNFRKKILTLNILQEYRTKQPASSTSPALYSFTGSALQLFEKPFNQSRSK